MNRVTSINSFKDKENCIHKTFYDYSLVEYKSSNDKVKIICPIHGVFEQVLISNDGRQHTKVFGAHVRRRKKSTNVETDGGEKEANAIVWFRILYRRRR